MFGNKDKEKKNRKEIYYVNRLYEELKRLPPLTVLRAFGIFYKDLIITNEDYSKEFKAKIIANHFLFDKCLKDIAFENKMALGYLIELIEEKDSVESILKKIREFVK